MKRLAAQRSFVSEFLILLQSKFYINRHNNISSYVVCLNRKDTLVWVWPSCVQILTTMISTAVAFAAVLWCPLVSQWFIRPHLTFDATYSFHLIYLSIWLQYLQWETELRRMRWCWITFHLLDRGRKVLGVSRTPGIPSPSSSTTSLHLPKKKGGVCISLNVFDENNKR